MRSTEAFQCCSAVFFVMLTNVAAAALTAQPQRLTFDPQSVGTSSGPASITVTNTSNGVVAVQGVRVYASSCPIGGTPSEPCFVAQQEEVASFNANSPCATLGPNQSCAITVMFAPVTSRRLDALVEVTVSDSSVARTSLSGIGRPAQGSSGTVLAIEFYNAGLDHYFLTHLQTEIQSLDAGTTSGWTRTGYSFWVWPDQATAPAGAVAACRFYGLPSAGLDSHFYTLSSFECAEVSRRFGASWQLESSTFFSAFLPDPVTGHCASGTQPIYRLYNNRKDANHRYIAFPRLDWLSLHNMGWISEGYGNLGVAFCAAPGVYEI